MDELNQQYLARATSIWASKKSTKTLEDDGFYLFPVPKRMGLETHKNRGKS